MNLWMLSLVMIGNLITFNLFILLQTLLNIQFSPLTVNLVVLAYFLVVFMLCFKCRDLHNEIYKLQHRR